MVLKIYLVEEVIVANAADIEHSENEIKRYDLTIKNSIIIGN